jgi:hypothetical protein
MQQLKGIFRVGQVLLAVAFVFAIVGCSSNDITGPQSTATGGGIVGASPQDAANSVYTFKYEGVVAKVDPDLRVIQFVGSDFSSSNLQVEVARDAEMVIMPGNQIIPFDFKFVTPGVYLLVQGESRGGQDALVSFAQVGTGTAIIQGTPNALAKSGPSYPPSTFKYSGEVAKFDADQRLIQFVGADFSSQNLTVEINRDAQMQLGPGSQTIPFDFKFINVGTSITVQGQSRADGPAEIDFAAINVWTTDIVANPSF